MNVSVDVFHGDCVSSEPEGEKLTCNFCKRNKERGSDQATESRLGEEEEDGRNEGEISERENALQNILSPSLPPKTIITDVKIRTAHINGHNAVLK